VDNISPPLESPPLRASSWSLLLVVTTQVWFVHCDNKAKKSSGEEERTEAKAKKSPLTNAGGFGADFEAGELHPELCDLYRP
jgi:hypothetical protein